MLPNIGWPEILLIAAVALLILGPKRLPEIGKAIGRTIVSFRKGLREAQRELDEEDSSSPPKDEKKSE